MNGFLLSASHSPSVSGSYFSACPCPALKHILPNIHSHNTAYGVNLQNIITHSDLFSLRLIIQQQCKTSSRTLIFFLSDNRYQQQCYGHCPCDCSAQQLKQYTQWRGNISIVLAAVHGLLGLPGLCARSSLHSFSPFPPSPSPKSHLASVDEKQNVYSLTKQTRADHAFL